MVEPIRARVLLVDDDRAASEGIALALETRGFQVAHAEDGDLALELAEEEEFDVVLSDIQMPLMDGLELLKELRRVRPRLPVILMTAFDTAGRAIEATKHGAFDYLPKPFQMDALFDVLDKAVANNRLTAKRVIVPGDEESEAGESMVGTSPVMREVFKAIGRLAGKPVPVLIKGETGTGKELVARALYGHSDRAEEAFIAVNCAAIPDNLIESELFGHERGAFTGAVARRIGRFEQADGGTLFLDEVGDLPPATQVKLLRVLQERQIMRVGGSGAIPIDVRVISATHRDLDLMMRAEEFREDLYYRLAAAVVELPPLRNRGEDIAALAEHFFGKFAHDFGFGQARLEKAALAKLAEGDWPGNVRELENVVRKALVDAQGLTVTAADIEHAMSRSPSAKAAAAPTAAVGGDESPFAPIVRSRLERLMGEGGAGGLALLTEEMERAMYAAALDLCFGNQSKVAKLLGVSRFTVREKLDRFGLFPNRGKSD